MKAYVKEFNIIQCWGEDWWTQQGLKSPSMDCSLFRIYRTSFSYVQQKGTDLLKTGCYNEALMRKTEHILHHDNETCFPDGKEMSVGAAFIVATASQ